MGLYYNSFLNKLKEFYEISYDKNIDNFLSSDVAQSIYVQYNMPRGSFYWALNITKFCEDLNYTDNKTYKEALKLVQDDIL